MNSLDIQEDMRLNEHSPIVGMSGTPLGEAFTSYLKKYGVQNIYFICSMVYNLGRIHGKREERTRRKRSEPGGAAGQV